MPQTFAPADPPHPVHAAPCTPWTVIPPAGGRGLSLSQLADRLASRCFNTGYQLLLQMIRRRWPPHLWEAGYPPDLVAQQTSLHCGALPLPWSKRTWYWTYKWVPVLNCQSRQEMWFHGLHFQNWFVLVLLSGVFFSLFSRHRLCVD